MKVELETLGDNVNGLKVSTEDYSLCGHIVQEYSQSEVQDLEDKVKKDGDKGVKVFFYAIVPKDGKTKMDGRNVVEIKINICQVQPIESW